MIDIKPKEKTTTKTVDRIGQKFGKLTIESIGDYYIDKIGRKRVLLNCYCDCGNRKAIISDSVLHGKTKSCGCLGLPIKQDKGMAAFNALYSRYMFNAANREYEFALTKDQFKILTQKDCYYCGSTPKNLYSNTKMNGTYTYNGIDRVDNNKGYVINNVVTCCKHCNIAKRALSQKEFLELVENIYHNRIKFELFSIN